MSFFLRLARWKKAASLLSSRAISVHQASSVVQTNKQASRNGHSWLPECSVALSKQTKDIQTSGKTDSDETKDKWGVPDWRISVSQSVSKSDLLRVDLLRSSSFSPSFRHQSEHIIRDIHWIPLTSLDLFLFDLLPFYRSHFTSACG